ncbi:uncharacterized protein BYT42DRAFT_546700 [Radiomyces spectabilis]|uniref:uncharacterized protein n=1 Tax=Radiomyces spectabilis TaxID=64574 RepID=UPI0022212741|nr:uncharacterized protein BYT42DRAFT_546700 [Radiomyces spectabilis]KAI8375964.1 hypothetical protein BYT42DRAFT_546700 [Radiomyces spectabilis]
MTLTALSHKPSQPSMSKWRRGFHIFSKWSSKKRNHSPTTIAAATEKYVRHRSTQPTVKCEDLTAKEFAQLTGIKIIQSHHDDIEDDDDSDQNGDSHLDIHAATVGYPLTVHSSRTAMSSESRKPASLPRIWDSDFWHGSYRKSLPVSYVSSASNHTAISSVGSMSSSGSTAGASSTSHDTPFISHLRRRSIANDTNSMQRGTSIIRKGRFKIVLGPETGDTPPPTPVFEQCVEWKRKRNPSNPPSP